MNIDTAVASGSGAQLQASIKLSSGQQDQLESVVGTLLEGVEETPAPKTEGVGQLLNVTA